MTEIKRKYEEKLLFLDRRRDKLLMWLNIVCIWLNVYA